MECLKHITEKHFLIHSAGDSAELFHICNITFSHCNISSTDAYAHILDLLYVKLSFHIEEKRRKMYVIGRIVVESNSLLGQEPKC